MLFTSHNKQKKKQTEEDLDVSGTMEDRLIPHVKSVAERTECLRQVVEADMRDHEQRCVAEDRVRPCGDVCRCAMLAKVMMSVTIASAEMNSMLQVVEGRR